jgi:FixJ family two-component response regulator
LDLARHGVQSRVCGQPERDGDLNDTPADKDRPVCIVENDDWVRDSLTFLLETHGFAVRAYRSGAEFLGDDKCRTAKCLIVDQHMPGMYGLDVVAELRRRAVSVPTILITGRLDAAISRRAGELGVRAVLEKPFSVAQLVELI